MKIFSLKVILKVNNFFDFTLDSFFYCVGVFSIVDSYLKLKN